MEWVSDGECVVPRGMINGEGGEECVCHRVIDGNVSLG